MSWIQNAAIYHILIDRFAGYDPAKDWTKPEHMGGNIRGIIDKFDYIRSLGVNTVWISPFYQSTSFHGYDITDFLTVDERFGTEDDLRELIDLAHRHGMKIIADFVPNHVSHEHPFFVDAQTDPNSRYRDWFFFQKWPDKYLPFVIYPTMAKLNFGSPDVLAHVLGAGRKWLGLGLDGFRIDHVMGLQNHAVSELFGTLRREFPDRAFVGEAAIFGLDGEPASSTINVRGVKTLGAPHKYLVWALHQFGLNMLYRNYVGRLDGMLDFYFTHHMVKFAHAASEQERQRIAQKLRRHIDSYPDDFSMVLFLDNHDLTRYLFRCDGDTSKLLAAAKLQFSLKGPKAIYYGTEIGLSQDMPFLKSPGRDIQARKPMVWDEGAQDLDLLEKYKAIVKLYQNFQ